MPSQIRDMTMGAVNKRARNYEDISQREDKRWGHWIVIEYAGSCGEAYYRCRCSVCGHEKKVGRRELRTAKINNYKGCAECRRPGSPQWHKRAAERVASKAAE